jgi:hypothetical protein
MKYFLLIAGNSYYPSHDTGDWIKCFETYEEARSQVEVKKHHTFFTKGKNKGEIKDTYESYIVNGRKRDWYEIVDLREWINESS